MKPQSGVDGRQDGEGRADVRLCYGIVFLVAATILAFLPLFQNELVNYDDPYTLQHNERLGAPGVLTWAFTTTLMGHYQPLSWLAWSLLKALFGVNPFALHAASLALHLTNAVLVCLLAVRLGAAGGLRPGPRRLAAIVASTLFAVHPARVEVVAWASALPYLLSLMWLLLATLAYVAYGTTLAKASRLRWYAASLACYLLSLLSRAVGLGFPFVLLALDIYPLRRRASPRGPKSIARPALVEKLPFLLAALLAALVESQSRELTGMQEVGLGARLTMAVTAPLVYLGRTVLPFGRSPIDARPMQPHLDWVPLLLGLAGLALLSLAVWRRRRQWPALFVTWLAFLLLLAPMMGLTPSGQQAIADRYHYFPGVVLSLLAGVIAARLTSEIPRGRASRLGAEGSLRPRWLVLMITFVGVLGTATWRQTRWWHDSITLWTRAADLDPRNDIATYNLGIALEEAGREGEAAVRYEHTLSLVPDHAPARHNLTVIRVRQAERRGNEFAAAGSFDEAISEYSRALELDATNTSARASRGIARVRRERFAEAVEDLRAGLDARPDDLALVNALAFALVQTARSGEAVSVLKQALARHPQDDDLAHNLARVLATTSDPAVRDSGLALRLAMAVRDRTGGRDPRVLDTLAAAYAAGGDLGRARATAAEAVARATQLGESDLAQEIARNARRYEP